MNALFHMLSARIFPPVPDPVRDEFTVHAALEAQLQSRPLLLALLITVPPAALASSDGASWWVRFGLPALMALGCILGLIANFHSTGKIKSSRGARKMLADSTIFSGLLAVVCSSWCVLSFLAAPDDAKPYYPLILAMGSLSTAYCLSSARLAAIINLSVGIMPISLILLASGNRLQLAAGVSLLVAALFLLRLIIQRHAHLVDLMMLKKQLRDQANTDPLTGLLNRRALTERLEQEIASAAQNGGRFAFALLDLDGFKAVNDGYGHSMGDALLCSIAQRLSQHASEGIVVARLGGDEFALLATQESSLLIEALPGHMLATLAAPHTINGHVIRVGSSLGMACWPEAGPGIRDLFEAADRALYRAKNESRMDGEPRSLSLDAA